MTDKEKPLNQGGTPAGADPDEAKKGGAEKPGDRTTGGESSTPKSGTDNPRR